MNLRDLALKYGKRINEYSCPIHVFNELNESEVDKIDKKYKIGERLIPYYEQDNCEECWDIKL